MINYQDSNHFIISIDTKRARALDDALSIQHVDGNIFRVGIHVSDVAALIDKDSVIDKEAQSRIASTYILKNYHKPMLPEKLNSDLCCLK